VPMHAAMRSRFVTGVKSGRESYCDSVS